MSRFNDLGVPTLGELMGTAPDIKTEGEKCSYCERGWSKGFTACPQCGLKAPPSCPDCYSYLGGGKCPECSA